jgi:hypothetical protein
MIRGPAGASRVQRESGRVGYLRLFCDLTEEKIAAIPLLAALRPGPELGGS